MAKDSDDGVTMATNKDLIDPLAEVAWNDYSAAVGGTSVSGDKLPTWQTLKENPNKATVVGGWRAAARGVAAKALNVPVDKLEQALQDKSSEAATTPVVTTPPAESGNSATPVESPT